MKRIVKYLKTLFRKSEVIELFTDQNSEQAVELGGNYCQDVC